MKSLFFSQWFDPEPSAVRGLPLAKWLMARGHDVEVLTGFPNYPGGKVYPGYRIQWRQRETMSRVPVVRVPLYPSHDRSALGRVANYASFALAATTLGPFLVGDADVGYVYHPPPTAGLPGIAFKALRGLPFVYHIADMWPESVTESGMLGRGFTRTAVGSLIGLWCRAVYAQASAITVLSPGFKRLLIERGVPAEKVHIIYNWTDEELFQPIPRDVALEESLGLAGCFNVVYAGNLGAFQGMDTVIRAAVRLRDLPDVRMVIVGTGQQEADLKALQAKLGANNVVFVGRRPHIEMAVINSIADVLLVHLKDLPFFATTIPSKTQVSLASSRPVLMAVRGDSADVIEKARAGLTCPPEDEIAMADTVARFRAMRSEEREAMGARGREFYMREMSLEVGGLRMDALLRQVAGARLSGGPAAATSTL